MRSLARPAATGSLPKSVTDPTSNPGNCQLDAAIAGAIEAAASKVVAELLVGPDEATPPPPDPEPEPEPEPEP